MALVGYRPYSLISIAIIAFSRAFCFVHASLAAFSRAAGAVFSAIPVDPRAVFDIERLWRSDLEVRRTPAYARVASFLQSIAQRYVNRGHGPPLNAGIAACSLA